MKENYDDKEIDNLFRGNLAGEERTPRDIVWKNIEKQLGESGQRPATWKWWLPGTIIVAGLLSWWGISASGKDQHAGNKIAANEKKNAVQQLSPANSSVTADVENPIVKQAPDKQANRVKENSAADSEATKDQVVSSQNKNESHETAVTKNTENSIVSNHETEKPKKDFSVIPPSTDFASSFKEVIPDSDNDVVSSKTEIPHGQDGIGNVTESFKPKENDAVKPDVIPETFPLVENKKPVNNEPEKHDVIEPAKEPEIVTEEKDSAKIVANDSAANQTPDLLLPPVASVPSYFAALHGAIDETQVRHSEINEVGFSRADVKIYRGDRLKSLPQQTFSYGGRFGWFFTKRFSLTLGAYYSIFNSGQSEGSVKYKRGYNGIFRLHSPTSSVELATSDIDWHDGNNGQPLDSVYISVFSEERYDYLNLQLGLSYYVLRGKHFGVYGNVLSNGAYLSKERMTVTIPKSGKSFAYNEEQMVGMDKFVLGGQTGVGFEWLPVRRFGIWVEPSFCFSGTLNKENAVRLKPGGMRYLLGIAYHF